MANTVVSRRNFDQPVLYTLSGNGDIPRLRQKPKTLVVYDAEVV